MSDKPEAEAPAKPRKGKGMMMKLLVGLGLVGAGGGGAFGMMQAGLIGGSHAEKEDNNPKLVRKGEEDPYAPKSEGKEGGEMTDIHGDGGSEYRTSYFTFTEDFTSNLRNSDSLVQVSLAASTRRDGRVLVWMKKHELAIRSALLTVLADTPETEVYSLEGKERLQERLTAAINKVLTEREGFGGIDAVYYRTFIIQ
ncbi:MAG: flagellar basal body-associated FliL family protein [Novosphingobium sp.]|nr:flagellar basal body-associated FliL family protein [Novosphingobium sp.]